MHVANALLLIFLPTVAHASPDGTSWRNFRLGMGEQEFARAAVALSHDREVNRLRPQIGEPNAGIQVLYLDAREERYVLPPVRWTSVTVTKGRVFQFIGGRFLEGKLNRLEVCIPKDSMSGEDILAKSRERYGSVDLPYSFVSVSEKVPSVWEGPLGQQRRATTSTTYTGRLWRFEKTFYLVYWYEAATCLILQDPTRPIALIEAEKKAAEESKQQYWKKQRKEVEGTKF